MPDQQDYYYGYRPPGSEPGPGWDPYYYDPGGAPGVSGSFPGAPGSFAGAPGPVGPNDPAVINYGGYYVQDPFSGRYTFVPLSPQQIQQMMGMGGAAGAGASGAPGPGAGGAGFGGPQPGYTIRNGQVIAVDPYTGQQLNQPGQSFVYGGRVYTFNPQTMSYTPAATAAPGQPGAPAPATGAAPTGYLPSTAPVTPAKSGFSWGGTIPAALSFFNNYLAGRQASADSKAALKAGEQTRAGALNAASGENYINNMNQLSGAFFDQYRPGLRTIAESLALGEKANLDAFETDIARSGLASGSGFELAGKSAIRGARQANYTEALRDFYSKSAEDAKEQAGRSQALQVSANIGAPVPYVPSGPSTVQSLFNAGTGAVGAYNYYKALRERNLPATT